MSDFINTIDQLGDEVVLVSILDRSITEFKDNVLTSIRDNAFRDCTNLTTIDLPNVITVGENAFRTCRNLTTINLPNLTSIGGEYAFAYTNLTTIKLPNVTGTLVNNIFSNCTNLAMVEFCKNVTFNYGVFSNSPNIKALILRSDTLCKDTSGCSLTTNCYIYVPRALVESYKTDHRWSKYADKIRALEDYTVDGTTTGALDETKV